MSAKKKPIASPEPLIDEDGEVRELTAEDFALFKPTAEIPELVELLRRQGRPAMPEADRKTRVTLYLDPDVLARLKALETELPAAYARWEQLEAMANG